MLPSPVFTMPPKLCAKCLCKLQSLKPHCINISLSPSSRHIYNSQSLLTVQSHFISHLKFIIHGRKCLSHLIVQENTYNPGPGNTCVEEQKSMTGKGHTPWMAIGPMLDTVLRMRMQFDTSQLDDVINMMSHITTSLTTPTKCNECPTWPSMIGHEHQPPRLTDNDEGPLMSTEPTTRIYKWPWQPITTINKGPPPGLMNGYNQDQWISCHIPDPHPEEILEKTQIGLRPIQRKIEENWENA